MRVSGQASSRDRLLRAGMQLFAQHGYDRTTTAGIAKAAHSSHSQLIKHFKDKHGVLAAALEVSWEQLNRAVALAIERITRPAEQLRLALNMLLSTAAADAAVGAVMALDGGTLRHGNGARFVSPGYARFAAILDGIAERMVLQGGLRAEINPRAFRAMLLGLVEKFLRDTPRAGASAYSENDLQVLISRFLAGCLVSEPGDADAQDAASVPDDEIWVRQYTGLGEKVLKVPPGNA